MRKILLSFRIFVANGFEMLSSTSRPSSSFLTPAPAPAPVQFEPTLLLRDPTSRPTFFFASVPVVDGAFDYTTLSCVCGILLISLIALAFIFHLRFRSRELPHLQNFNSLWTVRLLLVFFASLWAINEVVRLPFVRRKYLYPFLPPLTLYQQSNLCKVHVVLSLGFFEPAFLITLLLLVNESIKKRSPCRTWAFAVVCLVCFPIMMIQIFFVFLSPLELKLPKFMHSSSFLSTDLLGNQTVVCTYPLFSGIVFGAFAIAYSLAFLFSCWRVVAFVINKTIQVRVNLLATSFMIALPLQILCLGLSPLWPPEDPTHGCATLVVFLAFACCVVVGEVILVIKPISDALAAGGPCCVWNNDGGVALGRRDRGL